MLKENKYMLVDDEDFGWLRQWGWYFDGSYAVRARYLGQANGKDKYKKIYLHREINKTPEGLETDHIDRNPLNNQRANLRTSTHRENTINRNKQKNNTSGCTGVIWDKINKSWQVRIKVDGKSIFLGRFNSMLDARNVRKRAEDKYFI